jgi:hypothetical protein
LKAVTVAVLFVSAAAAYGAAVPLQGQIEGEVLQVFPTAIVIQNDKGQATVLQLTPRTQMGGIFKPGDKVIASVTPYGVTSIQMKNNTALFP